MKFQASEIVGICQGELLQGSPDKTVSGFAIDSRQVKKDDLFIPFSGEHTDGHLYIKQAFDQGAAGTLHLLSRQPDQSVPEDFLIIGVRDTLDALQKLASVHRRRFNLPVIGVTGSSGKTTTKDFIAGVLGVRYKTLKTTGNLNNEIGLPLTILELEKEHQVAVLEMGMSASGEIRTLCEIAHPEYGVLTNIGEAHLELLGSIDAIAKAKGELLDYLGSGGVAILNGDDPRLLSLGERFPGKVYYYGFNQGDIKGLQLSQRGEKTFFRARFPNNKKEWFESPLPGRESVSNALAALTVGYILELSLSEMQEGLKSAQSTAGRFQVLHNRDGIGIIDDSYNANPSSVRAALRLLSELGGSKTVAVLGDMLELGPGSREAHLSCGRYAAECGIGHLICVGELSRGFAEGALSAGLKAACCDTHNEALEELAKISLKKDWFVLVKGSRGMRMEVVVRGLSGGEGVRH